MTRGAVLGAPRLHEMIKVDGRPTEDGWYSYSDPSRNLGMPMPAWVFKNEAHLYVALCAVHEAYWPDRVVKVEDLPGTWSGPMELPR